MRWLACILVFVAFAFQLPVNGLKTGDQVPDFNFITMNGDRLMLDSVKGNVLVIDFWASWCQPCRKNNIELVRSYEKYRQLNFLKKNKIRFISFSMDTRRDLWSIAKAKDDLHWPYNVSDMLGWESPVTDQFRISKIPSNFIVDHKGIIVARDLWGRDLDSALNVLNKQVP